MDFGRSGQQDEIAGLARRILEDKATVTLLREVEQQGERFDRGIWEALADAGLLGVALPTDLGGSGLGIIEQCLVLEQVGRTVAPVPVWASVVLGAMPVAEFGGDELRRRWVPAAVEGRAVLTAALTEPLNRRPQVPTTVAERSADGWTIRGSKTCVPAGTLADAILVPASLRTRPDGSSTSRGDRAAAPQPAAHAELGRPAHDPLAPAPQHAAVSDGPARLSAPLPTDGQVGVFLVEAGADGLTVEPQTKTNRDTDARLTLDGVHVPDGALLATPERGHEVLAWIVERATVGLCAQAAGVVARALEMTAAYTKERIQFDRPIATFQAVGQRAADGYIDVEATQLVLWQAAWRLAEGLPAAMEVEVAKFWAAEAAHRVAHTAVHLHGGTGVDVDHPIHRYFIAAKELEFTLGGATDQLLRIGAALAATRE